MEKVLLLAKKLKNNNKGVSSTSFFRKLISDPSYKQLYNILKPEELIVLSLIIGNINNNTNIEELYEEIINKLFVFSMVEITGDDVEETCTNCGGNGEIICDICGGEGDVYCKTCNGDGLDSENNDCYDCGGEGSFDCTSCVRGYSLCDMCNGLGYYTKEYYNNIDQYYFVSFDIKLKTELEYKRTYTKVSENLYSDILESKKNVLVGLISGVSEDFYDEYQTNDFIFTGVDAVGSFYKGQTWIQPLNLKNYI